MQLNKRTETKKTHEGATAYHLTPIAELRRTVMACMLWENQFYESGEDIATRISTLVSKAKPSDIAAVAIEAREQMKLRHAPLLLVRELARRSKEAEPGLIATTLARVIQRPDELAEFLALYWKDGKQPISKQVKKGLAQAYTKFNAFQLAKYNRDKAVKLRDVLFMCHAKPLNPEMEITWKQLADRTLPTPDTWEVALSSGADKRTTWERLISENKLGALALLRNLRNMREAGVNQELVITALKNINTERVLPFRFISAAKHAPDLEPSLEEAMFKCLDGAEKLPGKTGLLIDVSGSMDSGISSKSDLTRLDAACGLAMLLREVCETVSIATFSEQLKVVPPRRGFALRDAVLSSQSRGGTYLGAALERTPVELDRLIVITDEQSHDKVRAPFWKHPYIINVASYKNGVGYGPWNHIDGWSEAVVSFISELERSQRQ